MDFYGFSEEDAERAAALYRVRFVRQGVFENAPYEGIEDVLLRAESGRSAPRGGFVQARSIRQADSLRLFAGRVFRRDRRRRAGRSRGEKKAR